MSKAPAQVPPGFESLLEPQTTAVDVYFGGRFLLSTIATFTPTNIEFDSPRTITSRINQLLDPAMIAEALSGELASNSDMVCVYQGQTDCGRLEPDVAGVIFDDSRFRVDIFVNKEYLTLQTVNTSKYLPGSDADFSLMQNFNLAFSDSNRDSGNYSAAQTTLLSFKESRLRFNSNYQSNDKHNITSFAYEYDYQGRSHYGGLITADNQNMNFFPNNEILGYRFSTNLDTRNDLELSTGKQLQVFLNARSRVEVYKDGRLLTAAVLDPGNQEIDTRSLPDGAYDVEIVIRDPSGAETRETRFYSKTNQLPPMDQPNFFVDVGAIVDYSSDHAWPNTSTIHVVRGGWAERLQDNFGGTAGTTLSNKGILLESGVFYLHRNYEADINLSLTDDGETGMDTSLHTRIEQFSMSLDYRKVNSNGTGSIVDPDNFSLIGDSLRQIGFTASYPLYDGNLYFNWRDNKRAGTQTDSISLRYNRNIFNWGRTTATGSIEYNDSDDDKQILLRVNMNFGKDSFSSNGAITHIHEDPSGGSSFNSTRLEAGVSWDEEDVLESDMTLRGNVFKEGQDSSMGTSAEFESNYGRFRLGLEHTDSESGSSFKHFGSVNTSLVATPGMVSFGGRNLNQSAVVVDISGQADTTQFDILVDGQRRGTAYGGKRTVTTLRPYDTYDIELRDVSDSYVDLEQSTKQITLYPGNVVHLNWEANQVDIIFGQILLPSGLPVKNALIEGVEGFAITDDEGHFQAEVLPGTNRIKVRTRDYSCGVSIPPYKVIDGIAFVNQIYCGYVIKVTQ